MYTKMRKNLPWKLNLFNNINKSVNLYSIHTVPGTLMALAQQQFSLIHFLSKVNVYLITELHYQKLKNNFVLNVPLPDEDGKSVEKRALDEAPLHEAQ